MQGTTLEYFRVSRCTPALECSAAPGWFQISPYSMSCHIHKPARAPMLIIMLIHVCHYSISIGGIGLCV